MTPADVSFGLPFQLFDDGAHGDGKAGDGRFGSENFVPPGAGTGYLWVEGLLDGMTFKRIDPVPYSFQPVSIKGPAKAANYGAATDLAIDVRNYDNHDHCYWVSYQAPDGWRLEGLGFLPIVCATANNNTLLNLQLYLSAGPTNDLPSGTSGDVAISVSEIEEGIISDATVIHVTRYRDPAQIDFFNPTFYLKPNGDQAILDVVVFDDQGFPVEDGTTVNMSATLGTIDPAVGLTLGGHFYATFTSGPAEGTAVVTAQASLASATTEIVIGTPKANQIALSVSANSLPADGASTSTLTATVRDRNGNPVAGQLVQIGLEGDGQLGSIAGGEVISGTTDVDGQFVATLTAGMIIGEAGVRAELFADKGSGMTVVHDDRQMVVFTGNQIFLPFLMK